MAGDPRLADAAPRLSGALLALLRRDLLLAFRHRGELFNPVLFFFMVAALFPMGIGGDPDTLALLAPGLLWVLALLATLLAMDSLFRSDFDDGTLEQLIISPHPLYLMVLVKVLVHWLVTGLPLALLSPLFGLLLYLPGEGFGALVLSLVIGSTTLSLVGAIGAALTVSLRKGGMLISLLILPFYTPVLILGTLAVTNAVRGLDYAAFIYQLSALMALAMGLSPLATAGALKISVNN